MILLACAIHAQKDLLSQILRLFRVANQMVHHCDKAMLVQFNQLLKSTGVILPDAQHEAYVRIAEGQLRAGLAGRTHDSPQIINHREHREHREKKTEKERDNKEKSRQIRSFLLFSLFSSLCSLCSLWLVLLHLTPGERVGSARAARRSCPQAASMSAPLRLRTFTLSPAPRRMATKSVSACCVRRRYGNPSTSLNGIRLMCACRPRSSFANSAAWAG